MDTKKIIKRRPYIGVITATYIGILVLVIIGDSPLIIEKIGRTFSKDVLNKMLVVEMFVLPLLAVLVYAAVIKELGKSLLLWWLGIVLLPLGTAILGIRLLLMTRTSRLSKMEKPTP